MNARLWDKGEGLDSIIHSFTVGEDPQNDMFLVRWDALASLAHAKMLLEINLLDKPAVAQIGKVVSSIIKEADNGEFVISHELEDCHTAIEARLTKELGEVGKRIHAGRSRNDQVLVALRLMMRFVVGSICKNLESTAGKILEQAKTQQDLIMPGYTHTQAAMPSSVAMWLHSYVEGILDLLRDGERIVTLIDSNPLGVGSGFGVSLPLNRDCTSKLLGFLRVERNPIHVQNGRGQYELKIARWLSDIGSLIEKCACDLMLYSTREFALCSIPKDFTTGSSLMPNKRNPDVIELLRASASVLRAAESEIQNLCSKLSSSYHRDFQLTKAPLFRAIRCASNMLVIWEKVLAGLVWNKKALQAGITGDMFATYEALKLVKEGKPFREAYQLTAEKLAAGALDVSSYDTDIAVVKSELAREILQCQTELKELEISLSGHRSRWEKAELGLLAE